MLKNQDLTPWNPKQDEEKWLFHFQPKPNLKKHHSNSSQSPSSIDHKQRSHKSRNSMLPLMSENRDFLKRDIILEKIRGRRVRRSDSGQEMFFDTRLEMGNTRWKKKTAKTNIVLPKIEFPYPVN